MPNRRPPSAVAFFRRRFQAEGDPDAAPTQQAYMKSPLRFHGVTAPQIRRAARDYCAEQPLDHDELVESVEQLYATPYFDLHSAAIGVLERRRSRGTQSGMS